MFMMQKYKYFLASFSLISFICRNICAPCVILTVEPKIFTISLDVTEITAINEFANTLKIDLHLNYIRKSTSSYIEKEFCVHYKTKRSLLFREISAFIAKNAANHKYAVEEMQLFLILNLRVHVITTILQRTNVVSPST